MLITRMFLKNLIELSVLELNDDTSPSSSSSSTVEVVEQEGVGDLVSNSPDVNDSPMEIDLILKKVLSNLDTTDLLTTRLVSHRWSHFATKILQKRVKISFNNTSGNYAHSWRYNLNPDLNLCALSALLNESSNNINIQNNPQFPCTSFEFYPTVLSDAVLSSFFSDHGPLIKRLKLHLHFDSQENYEVNNLGLLESLLVDQAPLLNYLEINFDVSEDITFDVDDEDDQEGNVLFRSVKHFGNSESNLASPAEHLRQPPNSSLNTPPSLQKTLLPNLTRLILKGDVSQRILEEFLDAAKHLQEVYLENENLPYLMKPRNRLHLLKEVTFDLDSVPSDLDLMEAVALHSENLRLKKLIFHLNPTLWSLQQNWPRVTSALNKILGSSSLTLEKITWGPIGALEGIVVPKMPNLWRLKLEIEDQERNVEVERRVEYSFFPRNLNVSEMFPKLTSVYVMNSWVSGVQFDFGGFFNYLDPVGSVQYLHIHYVKQISISEGHLKDIKRTFPNARLKFWP